MKLILLILNVCLMLTCLQAREFTLPEGKVEGDITAVANGMITLRTPDGRQKTIPVGTLTPDDLNHAKQWWEQNRKLWLDVRALPKKDERGKASGSGAGTELRKDVLHYQVEIRNKDKLATPELTVEYTLHVKNNLKGGALEPKTGQVKIPAIAGLGRHIFDTGTVELEVLKTKPGYTFIYGHDNQHKDSLDGLSLVLKADGRTVWLHETKTGYLAGRSEMYGDGISTHVEGRPYSGPPKNTVKSP